MIELYLSKVTEDSESEQAGKLYARVSYKQAMDIHDMAHHMAEHNTAFSEGLIVGDHDYESRDDSLQDDVRLRSWAWGI